MDETPPRASGGAGPDSKPPARSYLAGKTLPLALLTAAVTVALIVGGEAVLRRFDRRPLPTLGVVPEFALTSQDGKPFTHEQLRERRAWVIDFFFTSCPTICPRITARMKEVADGVAKKPALAADVGFLSFTVDPERDTPERLTAWGREQGLDFSRWRLATGPIETIQKVIVDGFHLALGRPEGDVAAGNYDILHGSHLVLVDGERRIRGYYRSDADGVREIGRDIEKLLAERRAPGGEGASK